MVIYVPAATAACRLRVDLKNAHPDTKFSVRTARGGTLYVRWTDGPTHDQVDTITQEYAGAQFDGRDDSTTYIATTDPNTGEQIRYLSDYVFCTREISPEFAQQVLDHIVIPCVLRDRDFTPHTMYTDIHTPWGVYRCGYGAQLVEYIARHTTHGAVTAWITAGQATELRVDTFLCARQALTAMTTVLSTTDTDEVARAVRDALTTWDQGEPLDDARQAEACRLLRGEDPDSLPVEVLRVIAAA